MNPFWKGLLAGILGMIAIVALIAATGAPKNGRYRGLEREGPVIIVDTQTGDFTIQGPDGGSQGHRWSDAWKAD